MPGTGQRPGPLLSPLRQRPGSGIRRGDGDGVLLSGVSGRAALDQPRLGAQQVTVLECGACGGFWLGPEAFRQLAERARMQAVPPLSAVGPARPVAGSDTPDLPRRGSFYRPCVVCGELMNRVNYGHTSGVIVDFCKDHGIWFDADHLARILTWLRAGRSPAPAEGGQPEARPGHPSDHGRGQAGVRRPRTAINRTPLTLHLCRRSWTS